jgi:Iron-sulfur cluster-binding domain
MAVSWDGKVTGCCLDYIFKMDLGDATQESLKQIWRGPRYKAFREAALTNNFPVGSPCNKCEFWQLNFEPKEETILDGKAIMKYGYLYRTIESLEKKTNRKKET